MVKLKADCKWGENKMIKPDMRDWSFAKRALYKERPRKKHKAKHQQRRKYYWVQVQFTNGKLENYQLAKDLQKPIDQHRRNHPGEWRDVLLGALINVPISEYREGQAKIKPGVVIRIIILPVRTHDPRWITRSQFVKPDYSNWSWFFNRVSMKREVNFLTHDFQPANQQRIKVILDQYRQQRVRELRRLVWRSLLRGGSGLLVMILLLLGIFFF